MSAYAWEQIFDDDEEESEAGYANLGGKNVVLFVVDARREMHTTAQQAGTQTIFQRCIETVVDTYKHKIFNSGNDVLGVVCFGTTKKVPDTSDFENISVVCAPEEASAASIIMLEAMTYEDDPDKFSAEYGCDGSVRIHELLWQCQSLISEVKGKTASRRILLLSCCDDPHNGDESLNIQARRKAKDLHDNNILLDVVPVNNTNKYFNTQLFYADIIKLADDDWNGCQQSLENLTETVRKKTFVKRSTGRMKFNINGMTVGVAVFNMLGRSKKPYKQKRDRVTNELIKSERIFVHPDQMVPLLPSDIGKFMNYGGKNIKMSTDEVKFIREFGEQENYLRLIGFRDKNTLKIGNHVKLPQFLYPCETLVKGSSNILNALISRCTEKDKIAVCSYKPRSSSGPSYVALVPQVEVVEDNDQVKPPGFHIIHLPFVDDSRQVPDIRMKKDNPREAVDAAKDVITRLKLKRFAPVENAGLVSLYKHIEAHGLGKETVEKVEDKTLPDMGKMKRDLGSASDKFLGEVYSEDYDPETFKPAKLKKPGAASAKPPKQKITQEFDMQSAFQAGTVAKLTVDDLKIWLKSQGVPVTGKKKAQLVEDVQNIFS